MKKPNTLLLIAVIISIFLCGGIFLASYFRADKSPQTLGETKEVAINLPSPSAAASIKPQPATESAQKLLSPLPRPSTSPKPRPNKPLYVIAAFGDSMVDTMGENLDYLDKSLKSAYPQTKFKLYNYGIGSQNVVEANKRFASPFSYQTRNYPPIDQINADIIIISSFAYNPLSPYDRNAYSQGLKELVNKAKSTGAQVYLLAEIAPLKNGFGEGVGGVNMPEDQTRKHVANIIEQLQTAVKIAHDLKVPLINAFEKSKVDGNYGRETFVGTHDGIHPSIEGEVFMAEVIVDVIELP